MMNVETGLLADEVPYIRSGSGQREAVVFLGANTLFRRSGLTSGLVRHARQASRLLPEHRFLILGYSGSGFEKIASGMAKAIRTPPDVVLGISLGGIVGMRFAARHPELVRHLVLLVSAHRFSPHGQRMVERQFEALERGDLASLIAGNVMLFRRPWYNWLARLKLWMERDRITAGFRDPAAILADYRQFFGPDFRSNAEHCKGISSPTLVVAGTADQYFDRGAFEETSNLIPGARLKLFERETHMLPIEKSRAVAGVINGFLSRP